MTAFLNIPPPMARLFTRIDAAGATDPALKLALDQWMARRNGHVLPFVRDFLNLPVNIAAITFLAMPVPDGRDWHLDRVGAAAAEILKPDLQRTFVSGLKNRLVAVWLRRILQLVSETEEPVAVLFDIAETEGQFEVEILAAPITGDHRTEAIFCGSCAGKGNRIAWHLRAK